MTARPPLTVEQVAVHFGGLVAISDMNFAVGEGEIVSLIGPNGAGKTTAFNVVTGFLQPTRGEVSYRGTSLNGLKPHQIAGLGLARTFQRTSVFPERHRLRQSADRAASARQGRSGRGHFGRCRARGVRAPPAASVPANWSMGRPRTPRPRTGGLAVLWRAAAGRRGAGAGRRAVDAAARRAGLGHERLGNRTASCSWSAASRIAASPSCWSSTTCRW